MAQAKTKSKSQATEDKPPAKTVKKAEAVAETAQVENPPEAVMEVEKAPAKAGKRSTKALKVVEQKQAKEARKDSPAAEPKPKAAEKKVRTKAERAGKKYREVAKLIDKSIDYELTEAVKLSIKTSTTKFDASVELHVNLDVDPKQADQNVRDTVVLPAGSGKTVRVAALVEDDLVSKAKTSGADIAGESELLPKLDKEQIDFEILIATPTMMPKLGKYARLLGPRGLMPNPKSGTVTTDIDKGVSEAKAGKVEYRVDQAGIVHLAVGKVGSGSEKILSNCQAVLDSIKRAKPASVKGTYMKSAYITTSMGPSIRIKV